MSELHTVNKSPFEKSSFNSCMEHVLEGSAVLLRAVVRGVPRLSGAPVRAPDIRAGAALVVAGLAAEGETSVAGVHHVDRGYDDLVGRLAALGADIERAPAG